MARFLADENVPRQVCEELRNLGHDLVTADEAGVANQRIPDQQLLDLAFEQHRILLTFDRRDFLRLHNAGARHLGIIICTFDPEFQRQASRIHESLTDWRGHRELVRVNRPSS